MIHWYKVEVNPEPWAIGDVSVGRNAGKVYPIIGRNNQLHTFKQAVAEEIGNQAIMISGPVTLHFYFWRNRAGYKTDRQRKARAHEADLTNLQKACEDALQGVLFDNDRDVVEVHSYLVEQGPDVMSRIVIGIEPAHGVGLPKDVLATIQAQPDIEQLVLEYDTNPEELF